MHAKIASKSQLLEKYSVIPCNKLVKAHVSLRASVKLNLNCTVPSFLFQIHAACILKLWPLLYMHAKVQENAVRVYGYLEKHTLLATRLCHGIVMYSTNQLKVKWNTRVKRKCHACHMHLKSEGNARSRNHYVLRVLTCVSTLTSY